VIARYALAVILIALLVSLGRIWALERTLAGERLDYANETRAAWEERAQALVDQQGALDASLEDERRARAQALRDFEVLTEQLEKTRDLHDELAESLRCYINWLRERAAGQAGQLPAASDCAVSEGGAPAGKPTDGSDERTRDQDGS
jgi:hypothetical protein